VQHMVVTHMKRTVLAKQVQRLKNLVERGTP
jgi:hypothetical protein